MKKVESIMHMLNTYFIKHVAGFIIQSIEPKIEISVYRMKNTQ